jgi:hypothetical protein
MTQFREQIKHLNESILHLYRAIESMKASNNFNTLDSGVVFEGNELPTYEETIYHLINGIKGKIVELEHDIPHIEELQAKYDDGGEAAALDAMERGISRAEMGSTHWSDEIEDPDRPTTFMGMTGFLATCKDCGHVVMLKYSEYTAQDAEDWSCEKSGDAEMIDACKAKQRVLALKADVPAMEYDEDRAERASGYGSWDDFGGEY